MNGNLPDEQAKMREMWIARKYLSRYAQRVGKNYSTMILRKTTVERITKRRKLRQKS